MKNTVFKTNEAVAHYCGAMEAGNHFKNGASSKSQMNRKGLLILLIALLTAGYAQAQMTFGARAGFNLTSFSGSDVDEFSELLSDELGIEFKKGMKSGFQIGVVGDYPLTESISIQPGILFATQGCKWTFDDSYTYSGVTIKVKGNMTINLNYLQIPVNFQYKHDLGNMKFLLQAGPYLGYGINGKMKMEATVSASGISETVKENEDIEFGSDGFNSFDLGLGLGAGLQFGNIQAGLGYNLGIANLGSDVSIKNNGLAITLTYFFNK